MPTFKLRTGGYTVELKTLDIGVPTTAAVAPSGFEYIPFKISNPYKADGNLPVDELGSSLYSIDPRTADSYVDTPNYGPDNTRMTYPYSQMILQLEANKYESIESISGWINPTDVDSFPQIRASPVTGEFIGPQAAKLHPLYEFLNSPDPLYNFVPGPSGVVLPEVQSITPIGGGDYTLVTDLPIYSKQNYSSYHNLNNGAGVCCRFNAPDIGGVAVAPSALNPTGTFDDPVRTEPDALIYIEAPNIGTTFTIQFLKGTPADFPAGQRLRTCGNNASPIPYGTVAYVQMGHPDFFGQSSDGFHKGTGILFLNFGYSVASGYPTNRNIPWTLPVLDAQQHTVGTIAQWSNELGHMPEDMTMSGIITMRLA